MVRLLPSFTSGLRTGPGWSSGRGGATGPAVPVGEPAFPRPGQLWPREALKGPQTVVFHYRVFQQPSRSVTDLSLIAGKSEDPAILPPGSRAIEAGGWASLEGACSQAFTPCRGCSADLPLRGQNR